MKKTIGLYICLLYGFHLTLNAQTPQTSQTDTISQRIVLIGDAGELTNGKHPVVEAVKQVIKLDKKTTVLYLGDNLYDTGLPDDQSALYQAAKAVLDSQLSVVENTQARVIMIPGNHDWSNGSRNGYETIIREQVYVDILNKPNVQFYPKDGCPGPIAIDLGNDVTVVIFDSQWWIHPYEKPGIESDCDCKTNEELLTQIEDLVTRNSKKLVLLACHHPFKSNSVHGGFFQLKHHIFPFTDVRPNLYIPLPVLGSIYPIARSVFGTPQDLSHPTYANMINEVTEAVKSHPHVVFVAGHDHGLQLIQDSSYNYIVSGGGCKINRVSKGKNSRYAESVRGFAVMEVSTNKNVTVNFYTVTDSVRNSFGTAILNFAELPELTGDSSSREVNIPNIKYKDTVNISASDSYKPISGFKKYVLGQNYRYEWTTPVNMKVFNINKERGGFTITGLGGGKQTKSLRLKDKNGKEWSLRSVDKLPTGALPAEFRGTVAQDLVQEFNSASHPYGPLTIPELAKPLNVAVPHPELFFVPDDPALGFYQPLFKNTVCMLEERDPSFDATDTKSTAKVFDKLVEENDHRADQFAVLRARLLDILLGDFDRHFDQWKWATTDTGKGKIYYPIPRDRDQAYFYSDGQLLKRTSKKLLPFLAGFRNDIPQVNWLGFAARDFDRLFLTDLDEAEWRKTVAEVQEKLTDSVITRAIKKLPPEIYPLSGKTISDKLISRRAALTDAALTYYKFISREVNVVGSNQKEYFKLSNHGEGLQVRVYAREPGNDTSFVMYDRIFEPSNTREIRLYGLGDDDVFEIDENAKSRIKLRIIGGKGNDTFNIRGNVENLIYDMNVEGNYIKNKSHTKNRFSKDPPVNSYSILGYKYNTISFPQIQVGANSDDGFIVGAGFSQRTYGFRNEPYATDQKFGAYYSLNRGSYRFRYDGEFNHITRDFDLLLKGEFGLPEVNNFFGLGNNTEIDENDYGYYRTRFRAIELQALLRQRIFERLQLMAGPYFYHYWSKYSENADRILGKPSFGNLDSADIYSIKTYLGAKLAMKFDNRNNEVFPTRGIIWNTEFVSTAGLTDSTDALTKLSSDMTIYASLSDPARLIGVVSFGGARIFSESFEYFQAVAIGNNNLHGFRANRYLGKSTLYGSVELRYRLFTLKSYLIPGPIGLTGFYDIGRVWLDGEESKRWHTAYGGGFYFIPYNKFMIAAFVGFSKNEKLFNFTFGTKINLSF
ncbi:MAG TPA: metallophosphoesterase [Chitinophagaceae bacterium]|nr:metallophosphoesterase [Chitinophagaceae bacterium]